MTRPIKFRGLRKDGRGWLYGSLIVEQYTPSFNNMEEDLNNAGKLSYRIYPFKPEDGLAKEVIPETVGQYTGLKDMHGVEIFEGDIVFYSFVLATGSRKGETREVKGPVVWDNDFACYTIKGDGITDWMRFGMNFEVIGNIHEEAR